MPDPVNTALLAYMLNGATPVYGRTKAQKTPFFVELKLSREHLAGPTFSFKRYHKGPWSQAVWDSLDYLVANEFIRRDYSVAPRGTLLLELVEMLRAANGRVFEIMDQVLAFCKKRSGEQLIEAAYQEVIELPSGEKATLADIPHNVMILSPLETALQISSDLRALIANELRTTPAQIVAAKKRFPKVEKAALARLYAGQQYTRRTQEIGV